MESSNKNLLHLPLPKSNKMFAKTFKDKETSVIKHSKLPLDFEKVMRVFPTI